MDETLSLTTVMVTLSGPRISRDTIKEALDAVGLNNVEVTWSAAPVAEPGDDRWSIQVATGHRVIVGALPAGAQTAQALARYLSSLLQHDH